MIVFSRCLALGLCVLLAFSLCACGNDTINPTVITKAPEDVVMRTETTTTVATTTTTVYVPEWVNPTTDATTPTGNAGTSTSISIADADASESGKAIAQLAVSLIGTPFVAGGAGPDGFDNPSFVVYCYKQNGYTVPRKASAMATWGEDVAPDQLQAGDILVFANDVGGEAQFCGIYIGNEQFVSCNNPDSPTKAQKLDAKYWGPRFLCARRPAAEE